MLLSLFKGDGKGKSGRGLLPFLKMKTLEHRKLGCPRNRPENHRTPETVIFIFVHIGQEDFLSENPTYLSAFLGGSFWTKGLVKAYS